jgi:hypothetical protein
VIRPLSQPVGATRMADLASREPSSLMLLKPNLQTPRKTELLSPPPPGTRKAQNRRWHAACFVTTKRPNRVGERAGNAQAQGAEPRLPLKRGASGARRGPTTEQRSRSCVPLGPWLWGPHTPTGAPKKRAPPHRVLVLVVAENSD